MEVIIIILLVLSFIANVILVMVIMRRSSGKPSDGMNELFGKVQSQTDRVKEMSDQFQLEIRRMIEKVARFDKTGEQVLTIADKLNDLERVLTNQKQRGSLGERGLELVLSNMLPPNGYEMQHSFKNNDKVDAIVKTPKGLIPIDAKFSLENYKRLIKESDIAKRAELEREFRNDLKRRIDETAKYIRPEENTTPFAFMFVPAEGPFNEFLTQEVGASKASERNLIDYAYVDRKVIIVSPTTLAAYLLTVLHVFDAFKIEEKFTEFQKGVNKLIRHFGTYAEYHEKLGNVLKTAQNHYDFSHKNLVLLQDDFEKITEKNITFTLKDTSSVPVKLEGE